MKRIKIILGSMLGVLTFLPALAFAQSVDSTNLGTALASIRYFMNLIIPILIGLAVIVFLWGVLTFIFNASDDEKRKSGKWMMIYGIIGIVVMVSVWGLVAFVQNSFGLENTDTAHTIPQV
jgi:uncharacterized membrane protein HdeD (DUF308 family)